MTLICFTSSARVSIQLIPCHSLLLLILIQRASPLGHGAPGVLACLWLEDSLAAFIPKYTRDKDGLTNLIAGFSTPSGLPRYATNSLPGIVHV